MVGSEKKSSRQSEEHDAGDVTDTLETNNLLASKRIKMRIRRITRSRRKPFLQFSSKNERLHKAA